MSQHGTIGEKLITRYDQLSQERKLNVASEPRLE